MSSGRFGSNLLLHITQTHQPNKEEKKPRLNSPVTACSIIPMPTLETQSNNGIVSVLKPAPPSDKDDLVKISCKTSEDPAKVSSSAFEERRSMRSGMRGVMLLWNSVSQCG